MYINKRRAMKTKHQGVGGWLDDLFGGSSTPNPDVAPSPEDINTGPTVQVSTIGGQVSSIPSSSPGGGYTTIGGFVSVGGVCKPTDTTALSKFKELQRQANRVADALSMTKIAVDGAIGAQTVSLISAIKGKAQAADTGTQGWGNFLANQNVTSCSAVAGGADNLTPMLSAMADALGTASSVASPSPATAPQIYNPITGQVSNQPLTADIADVFGNMSTTTQVAALAIAGGIGYFALKAHNKKTRRASR